MQFLPTAGHSIVWIGRTDHPYDFCSPCGGEEFALLLVIGDVQIVPVARAELSSRLVHQGCRYAVCFGVACSSWDDSIDLTSVMDEVDGRPGPFVMTTWYDDESIEDAAQFFALNTSFDDWKPQRFVVLVVGGGHQLEVEVRAAVEQAFRPQPA
jgi:hypothetical protein